VADIFLPFEYPRTWVEQLLYWNEQYVLAALLSGSRKFELVVANHFLAGVAGQRLAEVMPQIPGVLPGGASYWIRSVA
jgi:hypothetical protein